MCIAGFVQSAALYAPVKHDPRSKHNRQKSECSKCQQSCGVWACSKTPAGLLRKFLDSKVHQDWLKIDLHVDKTITVQEYIHTLKIDVNGSKHIQC